MKRVFSLLLLTLALATTAVAQTLDLEKLSNQQVVNIKSNAENGDSLAQRALGLMYDNGWSIVQDYALAAHWYRKAAEQGDKIAQTNLGYLYALGKGVTKDLTEALHWYSKAAEQGEANAQYSVGQFYYEGLGVDIDYSKAIYWHRKAAVQGHAKAQYAMGQAYRLGKGPEKNYSSAAYWYQKAAEQGHDRAQYHLGSLYLVGNGVDKDSKIAIEWFTKSAELGNKDSMLELGHIYYEGDEVEQNYSLAAKYYLLYEEEIFSYSLLPLQRLGHMYYSGLGVSQDYSAAYKWYDEARTYYELLSEDVDWDEYEDSEIFYFDPKVLVRLGDAYYEGLHLEQDYALADTLYTKAGQEMVRQMRYDLGEWEEDWYFWDYYFYPASEEEAIEVLKKNDDYVYVVNRANEARSKAEQQAAAKAEAEATAKAKAEAEARRREKFRVWYNLKDGVSEAIDWFGGYHGFDNYFFAELTGGFPLSKGVGSAIGVNLGGFYNTSYGRLGLHGSLNVMNESDSWGFRVGPLLRLNDSWDDVEWQLYAGIGPHWQGSSLENEIDIPKTCHLSGDVGVRINFHEIADDAMLSYSSVSIGCQVFDKKVIPTIGISLWPVAVLQQSIDNYTTLCGEATFAMGDGYFMGATLAWVPSTLGWYGSILGGAVDDNYYYEEEYDMTFTTGPVVSTFDGDLQFYGGLGVVADKFGFDLGMRILYGLSYTVGFQSNLVSNFLTLGVGFGF